MTVASTPSTLEYMRSSARELLNEFDAADGLAVYYTLHHDPKRTQLFVHRNGDDAVDGFLVRCQTGMDLFRPLITLRARGSASIKPLLTEGLQPNRPCIMVFPKNLLERVRPYVSLDNMTVNHIFRFDPSQYRSEINVLVLHSTSPDGLPRTEIKRGDEVIAAAGVNWASPDFAEIFVNVETDEQMKGLGRAVLTGLVTDLLKRRVTPLYVTAEDNEASLKLATRAGFVDTGAREIMAHAVRAQ